MADYPFPITANLSRQQLKRLAPGDFQYQEPFYSKGEQQQQTSYLSQFGKGLGAAGIAAAGVYGLNQIGPAAYDRLYSAARYAEEFVPGKILRTFQVGNFLSQFATTGQAARAYTPEQIAQLGRSSYLYDLLYRTNNGFKYAQQYGLQFAGSELRAGPHLLLENARAMISTGEPHLAAAYSRGLGFGGLPRTGNVKGFLEPAKNAFGEAVYFTGTLPGSRRGTSFFNQTHAFLTESIERANRLAVAPFGMEPLQTIANKAGTAYEEATKRVFGVAKSPPSLAVRSGAALPTLGRMALKWGVGSMAAYLGYQTLDWGVRNFPLFNWTPLDEGITAGAASAWAGINLTAASVGDYVPGLRSLQEFQEEAAPGSTELSKLAAFPLAGALAGATGAYISKSIHRGRVIPGLKKANPGKDVSQIVSMADEIVEAEAAKWLDDSAWGKFAQSKIKGKKIPILGSVSKTKLFSLYGAAFGAALILPFLPAALAPGETRDELEAIYSGQQEIAVRKGRWWEMGRSPWEGGRIDYYRPHWYPRMMQRSRDASMYGGEDPFPVFEWLRQNFTYDYERDHYYDRPYPVTGAAFEDIGLIGPALSATFGNLVKPPKLMHTGEWADRSANTLASYNEDTAVKRLGSRFGDLFSPEMGEVGPGTPVLPSDMTQVAGEQAYRLTELAGLFGFTFSSIKGLVTGTDEFFDQQERLQSASRAYGAERQYWDLSIGGGAGSCFVPGTLVKTQEGTKKIEEIKHQDLVLSKGAYRPVKNVLCRKPTEKVVKITTKSLKSSFSCTENHWIPVLRRKRYEGGHLKPFSEKNYELIEIQAREIEVGDYLLYEIDQQENSIFLEISGGKTTTDTYVYYQASPEFATAYEMLEEDSSLTRKQLRDSGIPDLIAKEVLRQFRAGKTPKRIIKQIEVDQDIAYILGWYLAEGSSDDEKLTYTMNKNELYFAEKIAKIFSSKFQVNSNIKIKENTLTLNIYSSALARSFKSLGRTAKDKSIPGALKGLEKSILRKLVEGLMLGDGWDKGFTSSSRQLTRDLADCLLKLGYSVRLNLDYVEIPKRGNYPQGTPRKPSVRHYLYVNEGTSSKWRFFETSYLDPVVSIEEDAVPEIVFDLSIEDIHFYTADGIIVHNTELFRRIYPHRRRQIEEYNPIRNMMPEWLPGPGEKSPDFLHGDPFIKVPEGEMRLPGRGYAERFPELRGVDPADYPTIHRFRILADIAPYSTQFQETQIEMQVARNRGDLSPRDEAIYRETQRQLREKKHRKHFTENRILRDSPTGLNPGANQSQTGLSIINEQLREGTPSRGFFSSLLGGYWEFAAGGIQTPLEALTPIAPASKFLSRESAMQNYKRTQVYGPEIAFWQHPLENFVAPFLRETADIVGVQNIPSAVARKREIEEYFDALKYIKNSYLANVSSSQGLWREAGEYRRVAGETLVGVNPYSRDYRSMFRSLPRAERDYFNAFSDADTLEKKEEILRMIPANERRLYMGQWEMNYADSLRKAIDSGELSSGEESTVRQEVDEIYQKRSTGGFPVDSDLMDRYEREKIVRGKYVESYADWYRRSVLIPTIVSQQGLPGPDFIGWHPGVDLDDIKLKIVQQEGMDIHAFNLWESDQRAALRKPFLDEGVAQIEEARISNQSPEEVRREILAMMSDLEISGDVSVFSTPASANSYSTDIELTETRKRDLERRLKELDLL